MTAADRCDTKRLDLNATLPYIDLNATLSYVGDTKSVSNDAEAPRDQKKEQCKIRRWQKTAESAQIAEEALFQQRRVSSQRIMF